MAEEIQVTYRLTDDQRQALEDAEQPLPDVITVAVESLELMEAQGFVRCNPDGSPYQEDDPSVTGTSTTTGKRSGSTGGN